MSIKKKLAGFVFVLGTSPCLHANTITVIPNSIALDLSATELVTVGIPFKACELTDLEQFRLTDAQGQEVPVFVKKTLSWHSRSSCSGAARAVKVQFSYDATKGAQEYTWDLSGRNTTNDRSESQISEVVTNRTAIKGAHYEPRVFAINSPDYLVESGIVPPTSVKVSSSYDDSYFPMKWEYDARDFDYQSSTYGNWLFDRVSTNYRQALRRGDVEYYREAYLSHEWWIDKIETTGSNTSVADYCVGGFDYGKVSDTFGSGGKGCDPKYIYAEPFKLHLALTGDDSWVPVGPAETTREGILLRMADTIYDGSERCPTVGSCQSGAVPASGFSSLYSSVGDSYTERKTGFGLQTLLNICELTGDSQVCGFVDNVVNNIYQHYTSNPDGLGVTGYLGHSWHKHQGSFVPYIGSIQTASSGSVLSVSNVVEDLSSVIGQGNALRVRASVTSGASQSAEMIAAPVRNSERWDINIDRTLSVASGNGVLGGDEGNSAVNFNLKSDRVFSPWMQSIIADGLWQYYHWTENQAQKDKVEVMLKGFANAIAAYGIDKTRINPVTATLIERAYNVTLFDSEVSSLVGCGLSSAPYPRYVANTIMSSSAMNKDYGGYMFSSGGFSDQHIPEIVFQLSLGIHFEDDGDRKDALRSLAMDSLDWFDRYSCTSGNRDKGAALNDPPRAYSWQNKADPFGTLAWVLDLKGLSRALPNPPSQFSADLVNQ